jgi:hypothetical protein
MAASKTCFAAQCIDVHQAVQWQQHKFDRTVHVERLASRRALSAHWIPLSFDRPVIVTKNTLPRVQGTRQPSAHGKMATTLAVTDIRSRPVADHDYGPGHRSSLPVNGAQTRGQAQTSQLGLYRTRYVMRLNEMDMAGQPPKAAIPTQSIAEEVLLEKIRQG